MISFAIFSVRWYPRSHEEWRVTAMCKCRTISFCPEYSHLKSSSSPFVKWIYITSYWVPVGRDPEKACFLRWVGGYENFNSEDIQPISFLDITWKANTLRGILLEGLMGHINLNFWTKYMIFCILQLPQWIPSGEATYTGSQRVGHPNFQFWFPNVRYGKSLRYIAHSGYITEIWAL